MRRESRVDTDSLFFAPRATSEARARATRYLPICHTGHLVSDPILAGDTTLRSAPNILSLLKIPSQHSS